jgi:hypothetical protein
MEPTRISRRWLGRLTASAAALPLLGPWASPAAARRGALPAAEVELVRFTTSPFPYEGSNPEDGSDFLDATGPDGRAGHTSPRGGIYYEDQTYSDRRVLVGMPAGFDLGKNAAIVVFFHGNDATLQRDVLARQHVFGQLQASGLNAALIAPQFAVDALDSSAGRFWVPGAFARFMGEAAFALANLWGTRAVRHSFAGLPIILVAYSGGYDPAAYALAVGGVARRVRGVILMDALVARAAIFADWIAANRDRAFFFSAYSAAAADGNDDLMRRLRARAIDFSIDLPHVLSPGSVAVVATMEVEHDTYMTQAWASDPLAWLLARVQAQGLSRRDDLTDR